MTSSDQTNAAVSTGPFWRRYITAISTALERAPWLLPLLSFGWGWFSFILVRRGEELARTMAFLAFIGWPWLLIEPFIRKYLEKLAPGKLTTLAIDFVTQSLQQELLFFSLPFIFGATQLDIGQIIFASTVIGAALVSTIDPIYIRFVAERSLLKVLFHAYCSWLAALVVLPMVVHLPLERAFPAALVFVIAWFVVTLYRTLHLLPSKTQRALWLCLCFGIPSLLWIFRNEIPAAGLSVREARITQSINDLTPGDEVESVRMDELANGVIAFTAIRAPMGVAQSLIFEWRHGKTVDRISGNIQGGSNTGWRTWVRKRNFPPDAAGKWTVDILTPQGQLLKRLHFRVD